MPGFSPQAVIFHPLKVEMDAFPGESVALSLVQVGPPPHSPPRPPPAQAGVYSDRREIPLDKDDDMKNLRASSADLVQWLERVLVYVEQVLAKPEPSAEDSAFGRKLMNIVNVAATQLQPEKLDSLVKSSVRDFMMVSYLSQLAKTQLSIQEKLLTN